MYEWLKRRVLALFKVPPEPADPTGEAGSVRVFRAAPNFYKYLLFQWALGHGSTILGAIVVLVTTGVVPDLGEHLWWVKPLVAVGDALLILYLLVVVPVTYVTLRIDYEMRWYKVTDRSLRIREGVWRVREMTMTFANIQNLFIRQGPLQRYLGIADLEVRSAGGGGGTKKHKGAIDMHKAFFRGVRDAEGIRDLISERLKRVRDAGLGDPDDAVSVAAETGDAALPLEAMRLLGQVRDELVAIRRAVKSGTGGDGEPKVVEG